MIDSLRDIQFSERVHSSMKGEDRIESEFLSAASLLRHQDDSKEFIESRHGLSRTKILPMTH